jgi:N-acetylglutamate synthase-like GNAT family acetyltransferase
MEPAPAPLIRVRRATLEDLPALVAMWKTMSFDVEDLSRRTTEFQVAEDASGRIMGAVGLHITGKQGLIHSEVFGDYSEAEPVRPLLWERLKALANNYALLRFWTHENSPFWKHCGMQEPDADALAKLPAPWQPPAPRLTLKLREDVEQILSGDAEFALFFEAERRRTQQALGQAKTIKTIMTVFAIVMAVTVLIAAAYLLRNSPIFGSRGR